MHQIWFIPCQQESLKPNNISLEGHVLIKHPLARVHFSELFLLRRRFFRVFRSKERIQSERGKSIECEIHVLKK